MYKDISDKVSIAYRRGCFQELWKIKVLVEKFSSICYNSIVLQIQDRLRTNLTQQELPMKYEHIVTGRFLKRPNRFIAHVDLGSEIVICHVKNTGRCRELLLPGVTVILEYHPDWEKSGRKTAYDLIAVYKDKLLINMDSQAPNQAAWEWMSGRDAPFSLVDLRREVTHGDSRFDLAFSPEGPDGSRTEAFMEVKGVTLEENGVARFPDAPTERGVKHLHGLVKALEEGYEAYVLFVIQMKGMRCFSPNDQTHPAFGEALREAAARGVRILAMDCQVTPDSMVIDQPVPVRL